MWASYIGNEILPIYCIGIRIIHYKDTYWPTRIMEGNTGFVWFCFPPLRGRICSTKQTFNFRSQKLPAGALNRYFFVTPTSLGEMIRMEREKQPPTAVLTAELIKSIGIMASFWGPQKNHPGRVIQVPTHPTLPLQGGVFWRGFLGNGIYLYTYLGKPTQPFFIGKSASLWPFWVVSEWRREPLNGWNCDPQQGELQKVTLNHLVMFYIHVF